MESARMCALSPRERLLHEASLMTIDVRADLRGTCQWSAGSWGTFQQKYPGAVRVVMQRRPQRVLNRDAVRQHYDHGPAGMVGVIAYVVAMVAGSVFVVLVAGMDVAMVTVVAMAVTIPVVATVAGL
jgi:hypothetical protein